MDIGAGIAKGRPVAPETLEWLETQQGLDREARTSHPGGGAGPGTTQAGRVTKKCMAYLQSLVERICVAIRLCGFSTGSNQAGVHFSVTELTAVFFVLLSSGRPRPTPRGRDSDKNHGDGAQK